MPHRRVRNLPAILLILGTLACLWTAFHTPPRAPAPGEGDLALYRAIVARMRAGEGYYDATHAELLARHYGLRSPLNWRTPTLATLCARSGPAAKFLLVALSAFTLVLAVGEAKKQGGTKLAAAAALLLPGSLLMSLLGQTYLFSELWAGTLILLSILLYARRPIPSAFAALAALFFRELAALYVLVLLIHCRRSPRTLALLLTGAAAYAAFYLDHLHQVSLHVTPTDPAYPSGYLTLQGLPFLLATARQSAYLLVTPFWLTAIYLPLAIFGLFQLRRLAATTGLAYLALFAVAGKPFNDYWGLLISPLLALAVVFARRRLFIPSPRQPSAPPETPSATTRTTPSPATTTAPSPP